MNKYCTKCTNTIPIHNFGKDCTTKDGYKTHCKMCRKLESKKRYINNKPSIDKQNKERAKANIHKVSIHREKYYNNNKDKVAAAAVQWKIDNKEKSKEHNATYKKNNKGKVNYQTAKRRKGILERTPKWLTELDLFIIECIYEKASELQDRFGVPLHVDHTIPLHGKNVSGFHCPSNLQIVTAQYNLSKNNKYEVGAA